MTSLLVGRSKGAEQALLRSQNTIDDSVGIFLSFISCNGCYDRILYYEQLLELLASCYQHLNYSFCDRSWSGSKLCKRCQSVNRLACNCYLWSSSITTHSPTSSRKRCVVWDIYQQKGRTFLSLILNRSRAKNEWKLSDLRNLLCSFFWSFGNVAGTSTGGGGGMLPPPPLTSSSVVVSFMVCLIALVQTDVVSVLFL